MKRLNLPKESTFTGPALIWKRIVAFLIDMVIVGTVIAVPFGKLLESAVPKNYSFSETYKAVSNSSENALYMAGVYFSMSILVFLYFYMMEKEMGQTIGKRLMNLYVVSDNEGLRRWQALVRNLLFIPIFPLDLLILADPFFMVFTKTNQRLSEILIKTRVVQQYSLQQ